MLVLGSVSKMTWPFRTLKMLDMCCVWNKILFHGTSPWDWDAMKGKSGNLWCFSIKSNHIGIIWGLEKLRINYQRRIGIDGVEHLMFLGDFIVVFVLSLLSWNLEGLVSWAKIQCGRMAGWPPFSKVQKCMWNVYCTSFVPHWFCFHHVSSIHWVRVDEWFVDVPASG